MGSLVAAEDPAKLEQWSNEEEGRHLKYETVTGFFLQDDPDTDPATFNYVRAQLQKPGYLSSDIYIPTERGQSGPYQSQISD